MTPAQLDQLRRDDARHEAAHAVVAEALGLLVLSISIGDFPETRFRSRVWENSQRAVVAMAGPVAEGRHPNEQDIHETLTLLDTGDIEEDDDTAGALAEFPGIPTSSQVRMVMLAWQEAAELLAEHRQTWQDTTAALLQTSERAS